MHRFPYEWRLADLKKGGHGHTVFGTFICGGGSTMGYKLAGYDHIGGVEIDPKVADIYRANHKPQYLFVEDLRRFNERTDLPPELFKLDILDGSPPCSTFSMAGSREKAWGKKKLFREGQEKQTLDDLVFVYCDTIEKLKPKVCLLENVAGLVKGNARDYCRRIVDRLRDSGYRVQVFVLNAAKMGVPQHRVRTFFIGLREDLVQLPYLKIEVDEPLIPFGDIIDRTDTQEALTDHERALWLRRKPSDNRFADILLRESGRNSLFNHKIERSDRVCSTLCATNMNYTYDLPRKLNVGERLRVSSFPLDYQARPTDIPFLTGMCVPPVMIAHIATAIHEQWLQPLEGGE